MSERGAFVTEYCYCPKCFSALKEILCRDDKYLRGVIIPMWTSAGDDEKYLPIIAGKIGALSSGGEVEYMDSVLKVLIEDVICHPIRIAVLAEIGEEIFTMHPSRKDTPRPAPPKETT